MMANIASSLILHKRINTTLAKANALRVYVEPLITKCKEDTTHSRRTVFSYLKDKHAVAELFRDVSLKIADRPGGYTRIIKLGNRLGDNAEMAMIELVDFNTVALNAAAEAAESDKKRTRRGRKKKSDSTETETETAPETTSSETISYEQTENETVENNDEKVE
jgi:large subunit ribosomal protein L17